MALFFMVILFHATLFAYSQEDVGGNVVHEPTIKTIPGLGTISSDPKDIHFKVFSDPEHLKNFREVYVGDVNSLKSSRLIPGPMKIICGPFGGFDRTLLILKDVYLTQGFKNIIMMEYAELVKSPLPSIIGYVAYFAAQNNVRLIGAKIADFIKFLYDNNLITSTQQVHLIGLSLGTHIAGSTGYNLLKKYKMKVGRITGLDPAGPFNKMLGRYKLNKKSANFVDNIHTDIDAFGTPESLGHADFFMNGGLGKSQVDCRYKDPITTIICAHPLAVDMFVRTVTKEVEFIGCECLRGIKLVCLEDKLECRSPTLVGEYTPTEARGNFYVKVTIKTKLNKTTLATADTLS